MNPTSVKLPAAVAAHLRSGRAVAWAAALAALGATLCFVPLFNVLSYELSFAVGLLAAFGAVHLGVHQVVQARRAGEVASPLRLFAWAFASGVGLLLLAPLLLVSLNALRVPVCDYTAGLAFYLALPVATVACASAVGVAAGLAVRRPGRATALGMAVVVASLGVALYRFWAAPPIFAYDPFGGYFPGALYDEDVRAGAPLLWARLYHLAGIIALLAAVSAVADHHALRLRAALWRAPGRRRAAALALVAFVAAGALYLAGPYFGFRHDAASIARALGGRRDTPHFTIIYPKTGDAARHLDQLVEDHEFAYARLREILGVAPGHITSYVFGSAAEKRRFMGAARVQVAKPWRREVYLQYTRFPLPVLRHELAHVFAGEFAGGPFRVPMRPTLWGPRRRPLIDVGLIEGVAEAASWAGGGRLTPDQWSRALDELGKRPPLRRVFGLGFFTASAPLSYTIAGSFCHFLLATRGAPKLRAVYRSGGDFQGVYGRSLGALEQEWVAFLRTVPLTDEDRELARDRFRRPSIFHVPCAHVVAARRRRAASLYRAGDTAEAMAELRAVCRDDPGDPSGPLDLAAALAEAGDLTAARRTVTGLLGRPLPGATRARAISVLADLELRAGDNAAARHALDRLLALPADDGVKRGATARLLALDDARLGRPLRTILVPRRADDGDDALLLLRLRDVVDAAPDLGIGPYLLGRQLQLRGRPREALPWLERAARLPLPDERFRREARRLEAYAAYGAGAAASATAIAHAIVADPTSPVALRLEAEDLLARIAFDARTGLGPKPAAATRPAPAP